MIDVGDALLKLGVDSKDMDNALSTLGSKIQSGLGTAVKGIGVGLAAAGTAAIGFGIASVKSFSDAGSEIYDMSKRTGAGAEFLSTLKYMAEQSGSSLGGMEAGIKKMQRAITDGNQAWTDYGISLEKLQGLSVEEQFNMITDALAEIQDPTQKASMAMEVFGRSGTDLLPILSDGKAGMDAMKQRAKELGVVFTDETASKADELGDSMADVQKAMDGVMNEIALALMPAIMPLIDAFLELIKALPLKEIGELIKKLLPPLVELLLKLLDAIPLDKMLNFVEKALVPLIDILMELMPLLEPVLDIFGGILDILSPVVDVVLRVVGAIAQLIGQLSNPILNTIGDIFGTAGNWMQDTFGGFGDFFLPSFAGYEGIVPGAPGQPMAAIIHGGERISQGRGGDTYITVQGSIWSERELADMIERRMSTRISNQQVLDY